MRNAQAALVAMAILLSTMPLYAHDDSHQEQAPYGEPGNPTGPIRDVVVKMGEGDGTMSFSPAVIEVKKDEQLRFILENDGELDHEFLFGTEQEMTDHADMMRAMPDMKHSYANAMSVAAKSKGSLIWHFTNAGEFPFACLIPGHVEAGMKGSIVVK